MKFISVLLLTCRAYGASALMIYILLATNMSRLQRDASSKLLNLMALSADRIFAA